MFGRLRELDTPQDLRTNPARPVEWMYPINVSEAELVALGELVRACVQTGDRSAQRRAKAALALTPLGHELLNGLNGSRASYRDWRTHVRRMSGHLSIGGDGAAMVAFANTARGPEFVAIGEGGSDGLPVTPGMMGIFGETIGMAARLANDGAAGRLFDPLDGHNPRKGFVGELRDALTSRPGELRTVDAMLSGLMSQSYANVPFA